MALPAIVGWIASMLASRESNKDQGIQPYIDPKYGNAAGNVQPGERRTFDDVRGQYGTIGESVAPNTVRVLDRATGEYANAPAASSGVGGFAGKLGTIGDIVSMVQGVGGRAGRKVQPYQMTIGRR